jgi:hypothetical protein
MERALHDLHFYLFLMDTFNRTPKEILLDSYREHIKYRQCARKRLSNPVHRKTGKPLKPSTIKNYERWLKNLQEEIDHERRMIRLFIGHGLLGNKNVKSMVLHNREKVNFYVF